MDELNILKEEMAALKQSLDKEQIVNDKLMRTVMRQRVSWMDTFVKAEFIILPIMYVIFAVACAFFGISQWYALAILILGFIDALVDLRTFRISPKIFSTCSMMEVRSLLIKQKKERFIHLCIAFPIAIIWLVLFAKAISDSHAQANGVELVGFEGILGGIIGGIIGGIVVLIIYRKAQKTNDTIIDDISD
ncbi:MAG: hypothetical protein K2N35_12990 [Muribaculaceae bacterium]|nr:hypothetical protein [Muribaculaceae bacterium]